MKTLHYAFGHIREADYLKTHGSYSVKHNGVTWHRYLHQLLLLKLLSVQYEYLQFLRNRNRDFSVKSWC
jgi:hypothetical protein